MWPQSKECHSLSAQYAIITLTLTSDYVQGSLVLCRSIRGQGLSPDVTLISYVPPDAPERGIDLAELGRCFDRVETQRPVSVSKEPSFFRFKEQYVKLRLWAAVEFERVVYMDSDFLVVQLEPILRLLRSPALRFGAVRDFQAGEFREWWNGGFMVLQPDIDTYVELMNQLEPFIQQGRFDTEKAEQGYVSAFFENRGFSLPTVFNLNLAIMTQRPELWQQYVNEAVAIHFTLEKPWASQNTGDPFDRWHVLASINSS